MTYRFEIEGLEVSIGLLRGEGWYLNAANDSFQLFGVCESETPDWVYRRVFDTGETQTVSLPISEGQTLDTVIQNLYSVELPNRIRNVASLCTNRAHSERVMAVADALENHWKEYVDRRTSSEPTN